VNSNEKSLYRVSAARLHKLQLQGHWEGFRLSQDAKTPTIDLHYDGKHLRVKEKEQIEPQRIAPQKISPLDACLGGFRMKQDDIEYRVCSSYRARLTWEHDGLLTWESPPGYHEGGKTWKLDRERSNADELRWHCDEGGVVSVFFWRRVPDVPRHESFLDTLSALSLTEREMLYADSGADMISCWHGIKKLLHSVLDLTHGYYREVQQVIKSSETPKPVKTPVIPHAGSLQSHSELPTLLGNKRQHMRVGIDVNQAEKSDNKLPNLLGNNGNHMKADKLLKQ